jgi:hypothetical protein
MIKGRFYLPDSYQIGKTYFYRNGIGEKSDLCYRVTMFSYRPHPAELVIEMNGEKKLIHRRYLFSRAENR